MGKLHYSSYVRTQVTEGWIKAVSDHILIFQIGINIEEWKIPSSFPDFLPMQGVQSAGDAH